MSSQKTNAAVRVGQHWFSQIKKLIQAFENKLRQNDICSHLVFIHPLQRFESWQRRRRSVTWTSTTRFSATVFWPPTSPSRSVAAPSEWDGATTVRSTPALSLSQVCGFLRVVTGRSNPSVSPQWSDSSLTVYVLVDLTQLSSTSCVQTAKVSTIMKDSSTACLPTKVHKLCLQGLITRIFQNHIVLKIIVYKLLSNEWISSGFNKVINSYLCVVFQISMNVFCLLKKSVRRVAARTRCRATSVTVNRASTTTATFWSALVSDSTREQWISDNGI